MPEPSSHADLAEPLRSIAPTLNIIGVSGGADSIALLLALRTHRPDVPIVVAHLDHETRGTESRQDATFVAGVCERLGVEIVTERRSLITSVFPGESEEAFRQARLFFFARLAAERAAERVLLAHHADDRAETVLLRLLRGGEASALDGLRRDSTVRMAAGDVNLHRPLLGVRRATLTAFLRAMNQPWREDASNASHDFARNRVRSFLSDRPALVEPLLRLADAADDLRTWTTACLPALPASFSIDALGNSPDPLARAAARRWLTDRGSPADDVSSDVAGRLIQMCRDRSTANRADFPGRIAVRRRGTMISAENASHG